MIKVPGAYALLGGLVLQTAPPRQSGLHAWLVLFLENMLLLQW